MKRILLLIALLGTIAATGHAQYDSIRVDTLTRTYLLHLPVNYSPSSTYPLVLNLHGAGSNSGQQEFYTSFNAVANAEGIIVAYPDGIFNVWNAGFAGSSDSLFDDVQFISQLIDTLASAYPIDLNRVYACGMSMGGFMSYRLACELEDRIAAIASVTGSMSISLLNSCNPGRSVPIMQIHGTADSTVLYQGSATVGSMDDVIDFWVNQHNCPTNPVIENLPDKSNDGATVIKYTYAPCDLSSEVILFEVVNGGHTWPDAFFNIVDNGITTKDISANEEIWNFFRQHTLDNPPTGSRELTTVRQPVRMYPNPASDQFLLEFPDLNEVRSVSLINQLGVTVLKRPVSRDLKELTISTATLSPGTYTIILRSDGSYKAARISVIR